jgi:hypothetical protein
MRFGGTSLISSDDNPYTLWSSGVIFLATSPLPSTDATRGPPPDCKLFRRPCGHHRQVLIVERIVFLLFRSLDLCVLQVFVGNLFVKRLFKS